MARKTTCVKAWKGKKMLLRAWYGFSGLCQEGAENRVG